MSMILECDIGNSRCKWRLFNSMPVSHGVFDYREEGFLPLLASESVTAVRACVVAEPSVRDQFVDFVRQQFSCEVSLLKSVAEAAGVQNAYRDSGQLGADRWAGLVAAYKQQAGAVLVVDAGSALTVDVVSAAGKHLGGVIVPGRQMMLASLRAQTALVRFDGMPSAEGFACNTAEAVGAGVNLALVGVVRAAVERAQHEFGEGFSVVVTGGDAELIASSLGVSCINAPDLVLDGLQWLLPVAEENK